MTYIAIVDDKKTIRNTLQERFNESDTYKVLFTAENGKDFLEKMMVARKTTSPDVVLMDIDMPVMNGIEAVAQARDVYVHTKFLMLSIFDEDDKIFDAIKAGANGYLLKDEPLEKIKEAIRNLLDDNGAPMSPSIARKALAMLMNSKTSEKDKHNESYNLSDREKEVLKLLVEGLEYKEIAQLTSTSPNTIRNHITNIYKKLHVTSKAQAIRKVINNNWIK
ncbi:MAG: response regulator transcription factor [Sphingobacteriaceae bacterium]|nr:response regulator transcription factor [Sphingobacteriaceae bacterium]